MRIKVVTYFLEPGLNSNIVHEQELYFEDWESCENYLVERIKIKRRSEFFVTKIGDKKISEFSADRFLKLQSIKDEFLLLLGNAEKENAEKENSNLKLSRIEIRIRENEKEEVIKKCKKLGMSISEYTRELYINGEIRIVPVQVEKDIRGLSINVNQIAKRMNSGVLTPNSAISELESLIIQLKKSYLK